MTIIKRLCLCLMFVSFDWAGSIECRSISKEVWTDVRLVNGRTVYEGRVEVKVNGTWGTVCDDMWSGYDGNIVCRQLGFDGVSAVLPGGSFGNGSGPIFHDDLRCTRTDTTLAECPGIHDPALSDCSHAEDAGIRCRQPVTKHSPTTCSVYQFKCFGVNKCIPRRWVCDGQSDCPGQSDETHVVCQRGLCGLQVVSPVSHRIIGGRDAAPKSWPWMVSIKVVFPSNILSRTLCGGTLIDPEWVVTAAHCFDRFTPSSSHFKVVVGDHDTRVNDTHENSISIKNVYIPKTYVPGHHGDDVAVIRLAEPVTLHISSVNTACLPRMTDEPFTAADTCYVTGWGSTSTTEAKPASVLQEAPVPIIETSQCNTWYNNTLPKGVICAGYMYGGIDSCKGDSGGPLSCKRGPRWYLAGVTSWGNGCAEAFHPGIYTDVSYFMEWITDVVNTAKGQNEADITIIG